MYASTTKRITVGLVSGLVLAVAAYAQTGMPVSTDGNTGMDGAHSGGVMMGRNGPMNMTEPMKFSGTGMMNGRPCQMMCNMSPVGKPKGAMGMGHGMPGKAGMMGKDGMNMKMDRPMKMTGTMTMMGQTYHCTMTMSMPTMPTMQSMPHHGK